MALNNLADLTPSQFKSQVLKFSQSGQIKSIVTLDTSTTPASIDWRAHNAVTSVKDQSTCSSCYAFAAAGAIEGLQAIQNKMLVSFSAEQIVDCSQPQGNRGCSGGNMVLSYDYVEKYGLASDNQYPYKNGASSCNANIQAQSTNFKILGEIGVTSGDVNQLAAAVAINPVSVGVDATNWQFYSSGIFTGCSPNPTLNHAALLVGYTPTYWILKNSWGTSWGENGYIRLARGNTCGLANVASYPSNNAKAIAAAQAASGSASLGDQNTCNNQINWCCGCIQFSCPNCNPTSDCDYALNCSNLDFGSSQKTASTSSANGGNRLLA